MIKGFEIEFRDDHVHVELGPDYVVDAAGQGEFWVELKAICESNNSSRVLVEGSVPAGEREIAEVVAAGQRAAAVPHLWMAFHLENFTPTEKSELFAVVAASRGVRVKFFHTREQALLWLRNNAPS